MKGLSLRTKLVLVIMNGAYCKSVTRNRTTLPLVILSVAKDQPHLFDPPYSCNSVPSAAIIPNVADSGLPT